VTRRSLIILVTLILAMAALLWISPRESNNTGNETLFPQLKNDLNDISKVTIVGANGITIATLERGAEQWTVAEKYGYPADVARLRRNLIGLADAIIVEEKTADPAMYARLGVEDISSPDATGFQLNLHGVDAGTDPSTSVIVGTTGVRGKMAYVRRTGEARSLLVTADLDIGDQINDWLDRNLLDIGSDEIRTVRITQPDGTLLKIEHEDTDGPDFRVLDKPEDRELIYPAAANSIGGVLSSLQYDDVVSVSDINIADITPVVSRFETVDGLIIEVRSYALDNETWTGLSAFAEEQPPAEPTSGSGDEPGSAQPGPLPAADLIARAALLDEKFDAWLYAIPSYKSEQLVKRMDDLLESGDE
jgi:hypothetical protein